jgi:hypothetical protein
MNLFPKPKPYTQDELQAQLESISNLNKLRDAAIQKARLYTNEDQQVYKAEVARYDSMIEVAQTVHEYMMSEVEHYLKKRKGK